MEGMGWFIHRYMPWNIWTISGPLDLVLRVLEANFRGEKEINYKIHSIYQVKTSLMVLI